MSKITFSLQSDVESTRHAQVMQSVAVVARWP